MSRQSNESILMGKIKRLQEALRQKERDNEFLRLENARLARKLLELDEELSKVQRNVYDPEFVDKVLIESGR